MKSLLFMLFFAPIALLGQTTTNDSIANYGKVKEAVVAWADTTFRHYEGARFKTFKVIYSDEYLIAKLREKNLERDLNHLKTQYESGNFNGTEDNYKQSYRRLAGRKIDAQNNLENYQNRISRFYIVFCTNIKLVTGIFNYTEFQVILDHNYKVLTNTLPETEEEKKNSKILFR